MACRTQAQYMTTAQAVAYTAKYDHFMRHVCFWEQLATFPRSQDLFDVVCSYYADYHQPAKHELNPTDVFEALDVIAIHKPLLEPTVPAEYQEVFRQWTYHVHPFRPSDRPT
jgi:hypothetical protein